MMGASLITVISPAAATALADLQSVQAELGLSGLEQAPYLRGQIGQASAAIASWCSRVFAQETVREVFRPERYMESLALARLPVTTVASVIEDGTTLATEDYEFDGQSGILWRLAADERTLWRGRKITVQYTGGYTLPGASGRTLPPDIERACVLMVAAQYLARGRDPMLRSESAQDVGSASYRDPRSGSEAMTPQVAALLAPYRAWNI